MSFPHFSQPLLSVFQSLGDELAEHFDRQGKTEPVPTDDKRPHRSHPVKAVVEHIATLHDQGEEIPADPPHGLIAKAGSFVHEIWDCASMTFEMLKARRHDDGAKLQELQDEFKFSTCDPRWAEAVGQYWRFFGSDGKDGSIPYVRYQEMSDFVLPVLPKNARIGLFADWGTGTEDAKRTLRQLQAHDVDVLLHLGDIYYSGTAKECQEYFLDIIDEVFQGPDGSPRKVPVYTLAGNHDMYDGGEGYYGLLPKLNPAPAFPAEAAQPASYFALRSPGKWQLLCMDTALHDHDPFTVSSNVTFLDPKEEAWHVDKIRRWSEGGGRTLLFSHNQLFTAFDGVGQDGKEKLIINPKLQESYSKFLSAAGDHTDIAGWFWGHEHNLCVFEPYADLAKGRCIGHGAVPVSTEHDPYKPIAGFEDLPELVDDPAKPGEKLKLAVTDQVYAHGFVILDLDDDAGTARARYYQETDTDNPMYEETLPGTRLEDARAEVVPAAHAVPEAEHKSLWGRVKGWFGGG